MYGIDSGNGYVYGEDLTVEQEKEKQYEKEEKSNGLNEFFNHDRD